MAVAAAINTNFTATTGNLEKNTKRAEGVVRGFGSRVRGNVVAALPGVGQIISGAAIGLLVRRVVDSFVQQFKELGELSDQAMNLGIDTNQLQGLRFGASQAGLSAEKLDTAIAKMADTIASAADGDVKDAKDAVEGLGLSASKLVQMNPDQQLRAVADALSQIGNTSRRIQLARDIFGRSGTNMITFLSGGAAGIDAATAKFRQLGGTLTDFDVQAADAAGDALDRVGVAFGNLGNQLAANAAPGVSLFADALADMVGVAAQGVRSQFALAESYLAVNKAVADFIQPLFDLGFGGRGGGQRASDLLEADFQRIIGAAEEAARRAAELRGGIAGEGEGTAEKLQSRRRIEPASVERGTAAFIEAVNKASGARGGDIQKKMLEVEQKQVKVLENIERAFERAAAAGAGGFHPANLEP